MTPIYIKDENGEVKYTLEFNRESVKYAESRGFSVSDVDKYPLTKVYELFYYAFRMHHKNIARNQTDEIFDSLGGIVNAPDGLLEKLGALYVAPFEATGDVSPKNAKLTVEI